MNFRREMFGRGRGSGADNRNRFNVYRGRGRGARAPGLARGSGLPQIGRGHSEPQSYRFEPKLETLLSGGAEVRGSRGEARSLAKERKGVLCSVVSFNVEVMLKDHSTYQMARGQIRIPRQQICAAKMSATWAETAPAPRGRGAIVPRGISTLVPSHVGSQQASVTAQQPTRPKPRRAWEERKRAREASKLVSQKAQWSSSDSETLEEYQRKPRRKPQRRLPHTFIRRCQAETDSPKESEGITGSSDDRDEEIPSDSLLSSPQEPKAIKEKQRMMEEISCKRKQSVIREYPGAATEAAAGDMPRASATKKMAEEKKLPEGPSRVTLGRNTPSWRQMMKTTPLEAAALPPISGGPPFGGSKAASSLHPGPKQYKQGDDLQKYGGWKRRNSGSEAREDEEANRDPGVQSLLPKYRPDPPNLLIPGGEIRSGYHYTRDSPVQMKSQPFPQRQQHIPSTGPATSDYKEPPMHYYGPERPQQPCGQPGCSQCLKLPMDIENLKEQVEDIQSLTEKFQSLGE